jgi:hypothetical protein
MRMISPDTGAPETVIAEEQEEYAPLSVAHYADEQGRRYLLSRWRLNDADKARIAAGDDLYISLMTFGQPMQPVSVQVGPDGWIPSTEGGPDVR